MNLFQHYYVFAIIFYFANGTINLKDGPGVCKSEDGTNLKCCTNYQQKYDICEPCEVGTYGDRCTGGPCVYGYYGFGCQSKCNCTSDQYCDRKIGCFHNTKKGLEGAVSEDNSNNSIAITTATTAAILCVISILLAIVFLYNKRLIFIRQYLTISKSKSIFYEGRDTNRPENADSVRAQGDYSQWTRNSNNYNMLSTRRFNVDSKVNALDEEDVYDHADEGIFSRHSTPQDKYDTIVLSKNPVMAAIDCNKKNSHNKRNDVTDNTSGISRECYSLAFNPDNSSESAMENTKCT
ncbi:uncharacterized protein LOC134252907 [Saccostrea cucullata]|uniref:uncharacterized protein LOC134252907 n=1 Tax=Saccostrea cuccullata TaxID=36930 RepID=UPI002ED0B5CC